MLIERNLGDAGTAYLQMRLEEGKGLSAALLQHLDWSAGKVFTVVDDLVPTDAYVALDRHLPTPTSTTDALAPVLTEALRDPRMVGMVEEEMARRHEVHDDLSKLFLGDDVYYLLDRPIQSHVEYVIDTVENCWLFVGVCAKLETPRDLSTSVFEAFSRSADLVFVSAYVCDGFVAWRREAT